MGDDPYLTTKDIALTGIFCAIWVILNLTLGPLSFMLTGLPIIHDFGVFFTLLLVAWITGRFGTSSMTGIIGSTLAMLISGMTLMIGFLPAAIIFDLVLIANHHRIRLSVFSLTITAIAVLLSAYVAGVVIGLFFMGMGLELALVFWGVWHAVGGAIAIVITFPVIGLLERADVRKIKGD
ncbi:MAG: hypothetical protein WED04_10235 [Promethearchaeati archaeon SRVP18_Atabeyarchaeia-1]